MKTLSTADKLVLPIKWTLLVFLSAASSYEKAPGDTSLLAMFLGIFTFVVIYLLVDIRLISANKTDSRRALLASVIIKMLLQPIHQIEFTAGVIAITLIDNINTALTKTFFGEYLITVLVGGLLSVVVAVIFFFIKVIRAMYCQYQYQKTG